MKRLPASERYCLRSLFRLGTMIAYCIGEAAGVTTGQVLCAGRIPGTPDSIVLAADRLESIPRQLEYLLCCVDRLQYRAPEVALRLCDHAAALANQADRTPDVARSLYWQAWLRYYELEEASLDLAKANANMSLELYRPLGDPYWLARSYGLLAAICLGQGEVEQAKINTGKAAEAGAGIEGRPKDSLWVSAYVNTLRAAMFSDDSEKVRAELEAALIKYQMIEYPAGAARACKNLARICWAGGASEAVVANYFQQASQYYAQCGSQSGLRSTFVRFGAYYTERYAGDTGREDFFRQAVDLLQKAQRIAADFEVFAQLAVTYHHKAAALSRHSEGFNPYLDSTRLFYEAATSCAKLSQSPEDLDVLVHNIAAVCRKTGDCDVWMLKISAAAKEIATEKRRQAQMAQDRLTQFAEEQSALRQRNLWITAALMMLALGAIFIFIFFQLRVRSLNRELQAQLKMLQARLNPHFIANCMNAIDALIQKKHLREASNYIVKFTRLCRNLLDNSDDTTVSIAKEIETLEYYLDLEKLRLGDRLNYEIAVDKTIDKKTVKIPLMLIQPFVENAIWHGIQPKESPGLVKIGIQPVDRGQLRLSIEDDGIGRKKSKEIQSKSNREHRSWGMDIARQRIEAIRRMKGASFEIADLDEQAENTGTRVLIRLTL